MQKVYAQRTVRRCSCNSGRLSVVHESLSSELLLLPWSQKGEEKSTAMPSPIVKLTA